MILVFVWDIGVTSKSLGSSLFHIFFPELQFDGHGRHVESTSMGKISAWRTTQHPGPKNWQAYIRAVQDPALKARISPAGISPHFWKTHMDWYSEIQQNMGIQLLTTTADFSDLAWSSLLKDHKSWYWSVKSYETFVSTLRNAFWANNDGDDHASWYRIIAWAKAEQMMEVKWFKSIPDLSDPYQYGFQHWNQDKSWYEYVNPKTCW